MAEDFEILFKFGGSNKPLVVSSASLSLRIDKHLADLGFDTKRLATGEYILQKYSKKWDNFVDAKLCEIAADDIITVTAVDIKAEIDQKDVSYKIYSTKSCLPQFMAMFPFDRSSQMKLERCYQCVLV